MLTLSQHITEYLDATKDNDSDAQIRAMRRINQAHKYICGMMQWPWLEKVFTDTTVAAQQAYFLPISARILKDVTVTVGSIRYTPVEIQDPAKWDYLNGTSVNTKSDAVQYYHVRAGQLYLWPTPANSNNTITYLALRKPGRDLQLLDYNIGTVTLTKGSAVVTGSGTGWASTNAKAGATFIYDDHEHEILTVDSATQITLVQPFQGTSGSGLNYKIGDGTLLPEAFDDVVWIRAARDFYRTKTDTEQKRSLQEDYQEIITMMKQSTYGKTTSNVIPRSRSRMINPNDYPRIN